MSFAHLHKVVTYLLAGLGLASLTFGEELSAVAVVLVAAGAVASWFAEEPYTARPGWSRLWTRLVFGGFAVQALRAFLGSPLLPLSVEYAAFLQLTRLSSRRTARDHENIAALAFLHLMAATVLTTGLEWGAVFVGFVFVTPWMLSLTHLRKEIEVHYGGAELVDGPVPPEVGRVLASRGLLGPGFFAGVAALALPMFLVTAAFFVVFPRVGMGFLSFGGGGGREVAGFGANVELGGFGLIRDDPTIVLRVRPMELPEDPPPTAHFRLRGTSFDHYAGGRWTRTPGTTHRLHSERGYYPLFPPFDEHADAMLEIVLDPIDEPVVFLPAGTVALTVPPRVEAGRNVDRVLLIAPGLDIRYDDGDGLALTYRALVSHDAVDMVGPLDAEARARYTELPPGQERVAALAHELAGDAADPLTAARRIEAWLRDSGELRYSLQQPETEGRDPLQVFLFEARSGHCEYFSTALAVMARTLGIPARNVTGFVGGVFNPYGRYYAVRNGDAHSWVEIYAHGRWIPLDPTPPARDAISAGRSLWSYPRELLDALRIEWASSVVGYSVRNQTRGLHRLWAWLERLRASGRDDAESEVPGARAEPAHARRGAGPFVAAVVAFALLGLGLYWLRRWRVSRRAGPPGSAERRRATRLYRELEKALTDRGRARPPGRTPLEHAAALRHEGFDAADEVEAITEAYLAARFGERPLDAAEMSRLRALTQRVARGPNGRPRVGPLS